MYYLKNNMSDTISTAPGKLLEFVGHFVFSEDYIAVINRKQTVIICRELV